MDSPIRLEPDNSPPEESGRPGHQKHRRDNIFWAIALIVVGTVLFLRNVLQVPGNFNWWALFILIPAFSALAAAYRMYKENNRLNPAARGSLISGLILTLVAAVFLFGLSWGIIWPLVLVLVGLGILLGNLR